MNRFQILTGKRRQRLSRITAVVLGAFVAGLMQIAEARASEYEIRVIGSVVEGIAYWKELDFWGEEEHGKDLLVPRVIIVAANQNWKAEADKLPVDVKKELFYRAAVPLILFANELVMRDRKRLQSLADRHGKSESLGAGDTEWLRSLAARYRLIKLKESSPTDAEVAAMMDELLVRVDVIPPSLALGQAAYESGYGTSRFALKGNAFFGQWTWGGKGMRPLRPRKSKGDYKIATYDWPLDSVRGYMRNLNTQRAYAELRKIRAELRRKGEKLSGPLLADGLTRYSEQGQTYVKTLKGMIKTNGLDIADRARLREEPTILLVQAETKTDKSEVEIEIANLRASGELDKIIESMRLGPD